MNEAVEMPPKPTNPARWMLWILEESRKELPPLPYARQNRPYRASASNQPRPSLVLAESVQER